MPADQWSARFFGDLYFEGGTYQFTITADDEFELYLNGTLYFSTWASGSGVGQAFTNTIDLRQGYNRVEINFREYAGNAYIRTTIVQVANTPEYGRPINPSNPIYYPQNPYVPPQPVQTIVPINENQTGPLVTRYGDFSVCRDNNLHQSKCFQSTGEWNAPNLGSIQGEPPIRTWRSCQPGSTLQLLWGEGRCSKTEAGYFPK